jgi:hypothetical protein
MDNTLLFAYCITDGELDNFTEQQKKSILHVINNIKDANAFGERPQKK